MPNEFTAIIERDEDWYIAYCAEIPGANGQVAEEAFRVRSTHLTTIFVLTMAAIHSSHRYSGRMFREIGARFGIGESGVARASSRFETELSGNRLLKKKVNIAIEVLNLSKV